MLKGNRQGFTLIEMIMAIVLATMVLGLIYTVLINSQRVTLAQTQRMEVQQNARTVLSYLTSRLRELDATDGDFLYVDGSQIRYKSMRWVGILCSDPQISGSSADLLLKADMVTGIRSPDASEDSLLIFKDGDPLTKGDDGWVHAVMTGLNTDTCDDGTSAVEVRAVINGGGAVIQDSVFSGAPVRGFQVELLGQRSNGGRQWLSRAMLDNGGSMGTIEDLVGPLVATNGLLFTYLDTLGNNTTNKANIAAVQIQVISESQRQSRLVGGTIGFRIDTLQTLVALRNNSE
ncbi:MAG: prepilin-type N-terminal cleavage/methylation domain-containing protein [Gemmatimonadota bacterium]|nr:prepilin-type N-terminal cleavage/methylation domain-containing protein [Gemmatimonadota bacterium]